MIANLRDKLFRKYSVWHVLNTVIIIGIVLLGSLFVMELVLSVSVNLNDSSIADESKVSADISKEISGKHKIDFNIIKRGLFKPSREISKPMANKTIQKIKSLLKLQCIMEINSEKVAYIYIKGIGLKKCGVGDSVENLFTIININAKKVELSIVEHKVVLKI